MGSYSSPEVVHPDHYLDQLPVTEDWLVIGTGPKFTRLPGKVIYRLYDIEAYKNGHHVSSTAKLYNTIKLFDQKVADASISSTN